jgi:hypothetical protein
MSKNKNKRLFDVEAETENETDNQNKHPRLKEFDNETEDEIDNLIGYDAPWKLDNHVEDLTFVSLSKEDSNWVTSFLDMRTKFLNKKMEIYRGIGKKAKNKVGGIWKRDVYGKAIKSLSFKITENNNRYEPF